MNVNRLLEISALRISRRKLGAARRKFRAKIFLIKWKWFSPRIPSADKHQIHILIIRDPKYISVAKVCIYSFLYWNPNSIFTLHVDGVTQNKTEKAFSSYLKSEKLKIETISAPKAYPWQLVKLQLIMQLDGSSDIYMDADLRWNEKLPRLKGITFFVNEFQLQSKPDFSMLLKELNIDNFEKVFMRNLSFFTFYGFKLTDSQLEDIYITWNKVINAQKSLDIDSESPTIGRISEQLVLSIACENWNNPIFALKDEDGLKDGKFVESTYFGVTGLEF